MLWMKHARRPLGREPDPALMQRTPPFACGRPVRLHDANSELSRLLSGMETTIERLRHGGGADALHVLLRDLMWFETSPYRTSFLLDATWMLDPLRRPRRMPAFLLDRLRAEQDLLDHKRRELEELLLALDASCAWRLAHAVEGASRYVSLWLEHLTLREDLHRRGISPVAAIRRAA